MILWILFLNLTLAFGSETTYYQTIRPIINSNCVHCHQANGFAPFSLESLGSVQTKSKRILSAIKERRMPPFPIDNSGECYKYDHIPWLEKEEIDIFEKWISLGVPAGSEKDQAPAPIMELPKIPKVDKVLEMKSAYTPKKSHHGSDDYRCFIIDSVSSEDQYLTAYNVLPGSKKMVHHVILYEPISEAAVNEAIEKDKLEEGEGYTCFGDAGVFSNVLSTWAPGTGSSVFPKETGIKINANRKLIMQVHYNLAQGIEEDKSTIQLTLEKQVNEEAYMFLTGLTQGYTIPKGKESFPLSFDRGFSVNTKIYGVFHHMHNYGKSSELKVLSTNACLSKTHRWNFNWQATYFYEEPVILNKNTIIRFTCNYDTTKAKKDIELGHGTENEMCVYGLYMSFR